MNPARVLTAVMSEAPPSICNLFMAEPDVWGGTAPMRIWVRNPPPEALACRLAATACLVMGSDSGLTKEMVPGRGISVFSPGMTLGLSALCQSIVGSNCTTAWGFQAALRVER